MGRTATSSSHTRRGPKNNKRQKEQPAVPRRDRARSSSPTPRGSLPARSRSPPSRCSSSPGDDIGRASGSDEDEGDEDSSSTDTSTKPLMHIKGRIIGRQIVMFLPILDILNIGLAFDSDKPGAFASLTRDQQLAVDIFERIVQLAPEIFDEIEKYGVSTVASQIDAGRRAARSQDIKGVKTNIPSWRGWANGGFPSRDRSAAGFRHPQLGWFICPVAMDYSDVSIQQALRDGTKVAKPQDLCNLLYPESDGPLDVTDLLSTFLRSELLMQGGLHIFRGPSFALGRPNTAKKGNAAIHGIQSVTVAAIAYIACILRFVLSSQTSFSSGTNSNGDFASEDFYNLIIRTFSHMDDEDQDDLLIWWNERLYAGMLKTDGITNGDGTSAVELLEAQIIQKRLDRKAAADLKAAEEAEAQKQREAEAAAAAAGPVVATA